ncbi:MAG: hypothetical protein AAF989_06585, partial [Planctomycetota bacterium]
ESRTTEVSSIGEMLGSREIAERTVEKIGVDELLKPRTWLDDQIIDLKSRLPKRAAKSFGDLSPEETAAQIDREDAIRLVQKSLQIGVPRDGYTISVSAKFTDPLIARDIAQTVMDEYGQYHVQAHRAEGSFEFFETQLESSRKKSAETELAFQNAKNDTGWMSTEASEKALAERVVTLETALADTNSKLAEAQSKSQQLSELLGSVDQWVPTEITNGMANAASDEMRGTLYELQIKQSEEMAKLAPNHPRYRVLREKMNSSEALVKRQDDARAESSEAINPVHQELQTAYTTSVAEAAGLKARMSSLASTLQEVKSEIKRLNTDAATLSQLEIAADIAKRDYIEHSRRYDEARITHELDSENLSDVSVIQDASLNLKKASPSRALLAIVGGMLGLSLGLLQAFLRDTGPTTSGEFATEGRFADGTALPGGGRFQRDLTPASVGSGNIEQGVPAQGTPAQEPVADQPGSEERVAALVGSANHARAHEGTPGNVNTGATLPR